MSEATVPGDGIVVEPEVHAWIRAVVESLADADSWVVAPDLLEET